MDLTMTKPERMGNSQLMSRDVEIIAHSFLSVRAKNILHRAKLKTKADVIEALACDRLFLIVQPNLGKKTEREISAWLGVDPLLSKPISTDDFFKGEYLTKYGRSDLVSRNAVVTDRVLSGETLKSVGDDYQLSPERVRQITFRSCRLANPAEYHSFFPLGRTSLHLLRDNRSAFLLRLLEMKAA